MTCPRSHAHLHASVCYCAGQILGLSGVGNVFRPNEADRVPMILFGISLGIK